MSARLAWDSGKGDSSAELQQQSNLLRSPHTVTTYAKYGDYILGVVFYPKPSSVSDVAGIQSVHASLN